VEKELSYLVGAKSLADHEPMLMAITVDSTGQCCAALQSQDVLDGGVAGVIAAIERAVDTAITILGVRHVDGDGRDVDQPVVCGVTLVGFVLTEPTGD
jgi:hypothetical protein